jgi:hypothetical protein
VVAAPHEVIFVLSVQDLSPPLMDHRRQRQTSVQGAQRCDQVDTADQDKQNGVGAH